MLNSLLLSWRHSYRLRSQPCDSEFSTTSADTTNVADLEETLQEVADDVGLFVAVAVVWCRSCLPFHVASAPGTAGMDITTTAMWDHVPQAPGHRGDESRADTAWQEGWRSVDLSVQLRWNCSDGSADGTYATHGDGFLWTWEFRRSGHHGRDDRVQARRGHQGYCYHE